MTAGEKRLARRLEALLDDDYLCWYDIPVGRDRRYPDFMVLHPGRGLLFLEVKDWRLDTIKKISKTRVELLTDNGRVTDSNPLEQVRQYAYQVVDQLAADTQLVAQEGKYRGKLKFPYGYGVVFTNITRTQLNAALTPDGMDVLPEHLVLCKDEMPESIDPEDFQGQLWGMFNYDFGQKLSLPDIERIRWHLFPEVRIRPVQGDLLVEAEDESESDDLVFDVPEMIRVMDLHQEQVARNLGSGHRVIHGVAGSGKTMILGFRAVHLAQALEKPILILCFNVTLAAALRHYVQKRGVEQGAQVYHFHDWCGLQLKTYQQAVPPGEQPYFERQVAAVMAGVERGQIPRAQYGAVLIDEGHDFESEWLKLVAQMVDPETDSLLLLYDDAQSIYKKRSGLDFSLSSVGIQARGRTTVLKLNYRNSREILEFAYRFAQEFIAASDADDDQIPVIAPESAGGSGPPPVFRHFEHESDEAAFVVRCVENWIGKGYPANEIAVLAPSLKLTNHLADLLERANVPVLCLTDKANKGAYDPNKQIVTVTTIHSSKGLEFDTVVLAGIQKAQYVGAELPDQVRLLYVGMTRARSQLLVTSSEDNVFTQRLVNMVAP